MTPEAAAAALGPGCVYAALALLLLVEGAGVPLVPFEPVFLAAGLLIAAGRMSLAGATLVAAAANLAGNVLGYLVGRAAGHLLRRRSLCGLTPQRWAAAERWLERYGALAAFIGRFFGLLRTPAILAAGAARYDLLRYTVWSAAGALLWSLAWLTAATYLGPPALAWVAARPAWGAAAALALAAAAAGWWWRRRRRISARAGSGGG